MVATGGFGHANEGAEEKEGKGGLAVWKSEKRWGG